MPMLHDHLLHITSATEPTIERWTRLKFGDTSGKNEAWLRDLLYAHPNALPIDALDPAFGPLVSVCTEMQTEAGPVDNVFINPDGRITLVECKLWRNPEARRKVVAQILDYARSLSGWTYSHLLARVNARTGRSGNSLFELVRDKYPELSESDFHDATSTSLRQGRFMLLIAGDGIREDVESIGALINRNAAAAFSFGMFEVALFQAPDKSILLQPRVLAKTKIIERTVVLAKSPDGSAVQMSEYDEATTGPGLEETSAATKAHATSSAWWSDVVNTPLNDPEQPPLRYFWPHNVRTALPWPGTWITAYKASKSAGPVLGVMFSGREGPLGEALRALKDEMHEVLPNLPEGTKFDERNSIRIVRAADAYSNDGQKREWLIKTINSFVNELRPRLLRLIGE